jgi:tryptophan synthase alpha chain
VSIASTLRRLKKVTKKPTAVGFGIATPEHVESVHAAGADAAIVGSALVALIEANLKKKKDLPCLLENKVAAFKAATR